jgi:AcrR family transcriptional regulator
MDHTVAAQLERGKHDKELRQRALRDAATGVFAEKGYDCATTREVAERAGCSEGLIHRYFGGKRGLLLDILRGKTDAAAAVMLGSLADSDDLCAEVEAFVSWWLDYTWEMRDFMRVAVARSVVDEEVARLISELNHQRINVIADKLRRHQRAGRVRPDVDCEAIAAGMSSYMFAAGFFTQVVFQHDREELRSRAAEMARAVTRGIRTSGTEGSQP